MGLKCFPAGNTNIGLKNRFFSKFKVFLFELFFQVFEKFPGKRLDTTASFFK